MRNLTIAEINTILAKPKFAKAKRIAVENFLMTVGNNPHSMAAHMNAERDRYLYKWNSQTINAIRDGIELARN